MKGSLQLTFGLEAGMRTVMKEAVGQGTTEALVKEQEKQSHLGSLRSEAIGIASALALEQAVAFELAQIVAELIEGISCGGKTVGLEHSLSQLGSAPAGHMSAAVQQDF